MKKLLILTILAGILGGCGSYQRQTRYKTPEQYALDYEQRQAELIAAFKEAYPENWEQKLLEYQLEQERIQRNQQALYHQQEILEKQRNQQNLLNFWNFYQQQRLNEAQYIYYTGPYPVGVVLYGPARP